MSEVVATVRPRRFVPHVGQKALLVSKARYRVVCAGRRSGKSEVAAYAFLLGILRDQADPTIPKNRGIARQYWCAAPTDDLTGLQARKLKQAGDDLGLRLKMGSTEAGITIVGIDDLWIRCRSMWSPNQLVAEDVEGLWIDEAAKAKAEAWGYLEPCLTGTAGWVIASTTPEGMNWFYEEFWRKADPTDELHDPRYEGFHFLSADNPFLARICPTCRAAYRAHTPGWLKGFCLADGTALVSEAEWKKAYLPDRVYRREYMASFQAFSGQIWEELSQTAHWALLPEGRQWKRMVAGQDWNWALPGAFILMAEDVAGVWWILDEINQERLPVWDDRGDCWVKRVQTLAGEWEKRLGVKLEAVYCDPALPENIDTERRKGLPARAADNSVSPGLQTVSVLAHPTPKLGARLRWVAERKGTALAPRARVSWKQAISYRFQPGTEKPIKEDDHTCDGLRYALHSTVGKVVGTIGMGMGRVI